MAAFTDTFPGASLNAAWTQKAGIWTVALGAVTPSGLGLRRLFYNVGDAGADGDFTVTVRTFTGAGNVGGVFARWADDGASAYSGYAAVYDENSSSIRVLRYDSGTPTLLEDTSESAADGDTIGLRLTGTNIRALLNGTPIGTGSTDATYASGPFGIIDDDGDIFDAFSGALAAAGGPPVPVLRASLSATGANP